MPETRNGMLVLSIDLEKELVVIVPPTSVERVVRIKLVRSDYVSCRLGTRADRDIQVHRGEVYERMKLEGSKRIVRVSASPK